ncbi:LysR family transcriptional regulator [Beijerinckia sp. L45]|uniref:LysR family transcriptional regulator n=1 Tax=Beijerinckia sp. L45 TaxID=1641855 RepID=UPI00131E9579|nr:LysR family transcriptional regulator [Beijerinckia sp. L45]
MRHLKLLEHVVEVARTGSIRRAAERLNLTASAMNRRIQDLEVELGTQLFERRARGVRLTTAGEMFVRYARSQLADVDLLRSQIEDLRGLRRGPVRIACSQALAHDFLPTQIADFQTTRPKIMFDLKVMDHDRALASLTSYEVDLALVFRPTVSSLIRIVASLPQRLVAILRTDHPLAGKPALRLSDLTAYPAALPDRSLGGRQLLDEIASRKDLRFSVLAESNSFEMLRALVLRCNMVSFQIEIGAPSSDLGAGLVSRPIDDRDVPQADLALCQLRGRGLPVAASAFSEQIAKSMREQTEKRPTGMAYREKQ